MRPLALRQLEELRSIPPGLAVDHFAASHATRGQVSGILWARAMSPFFFECQSSDFSNSMIYVLSPWFLIRNPTECSFRVSPVEFPDFFGQSPEQCSLISWEYRPPTTQGEELTAVWQGQLLFWNTTIGQGHVHHLRTIGDKQLPRMPVLLCRSSLVTRWNSVLHLRWNNIAWYKSCLTIPVRIGISSTLIANFHVALGPNRFFQHTSPKQSFKEYFFPGDFAEPL